jgi:hypothetical protein
MFIIGYFIAIVVHDWSDILQYRRRVEARQAGRLSEKETKLENVDFSVMTYRYASLVQFGGTW